MGNTVLTITPGVLIEKVGDDLMVITPKVSEAIILSGHIADTLAAIADGETVDGSDDAVSHLVELGIVHTPGMSRRGLIAAGALGAGAGVVLLSMPAAAVSASPGGGANLVFEGDTDMYQQEYPSPGWFWDFLVGISGELSPNVVISPLTFPDYPELGTAEFVGFQDGNLRWSLTGNNLPEPGKPGFGSQETVTVSFTANGTPYTLDLINDDFDYEAEGGEELSEDLSFDEAFYQLWGDAPQGETIWQFLFFVPLIGGQVIEFDPVSPPTLRFQGYPGNNPDVIDHDDIKFDNDNFGEPRVRFRINEDNLDPALVAILNARDDLDDTVILSWDGESYLISPVVFGS